MMDKKLVYVLNSYSSKSAQHFYHVVTLLKEISNRGIEVVLIIEKADEKPCIDGKIKVIVQKERGIKRAFELYNILKEYAKKGYQKVFVRISLNASVIAILAAIGTKTDVYYWQSGDNLTYDRKKKGWDKIYWYFTNYSKLWFTKTFVDYFVTGPETMIDYYRKELKVPEKKLVCLYNDIDVNRFIRGSNSDKISLRRELGLPESSKIVLFIHRFTPVKRFSKFIPAIAEIEKAEQLDIYYVIIGGGPEEELIKSKTENSKYKDRIIMLGTKPNSEVHKYYAGADLFINPSYSEGFPRVVIEAMSAALPVVVTDVGGTRDILPKEQMEYLVDKDDVISFKEKVVELASNKEKCERLSEVNVNFVRKFSTEVIAQQYISKIWMEE
jgi:glycosyltransferase, family 1